MKKSTEAYAECSQTSNTNNLFLHEFISQNVKEVGGGQYMRIQMHKRAKRVLTTTMLADGAN